MAKLLYVVHRFWPYQGGSERLFFEMARRAAAAGHDVTVFTTDAWDIEHLERKGHKRIDSLAETIEGIRIRRFRVRHIIGQHAVLSAVARLPVRSLRQTFGYPHVLVPALITTLWTTRERFDLVHAGVFPHTTLVAAAYAYCRRHNVPFVCEPLLNLGEYHSAMANPHFLSEDQLWLLERADAVITITSFENEALEAKGIASRKIVVASPGVSPAEMGGGDGQTFRERHRLSRWVVLQISTQTFAKGSMHTIEAMRILWERGWDVSLVMIGQAMSDFVAYLAAQPDRVRERTLVLGYISEADKRDALSACDVFLMPSRADAFGIVFLEAWLYGKPVIGCMAGGIPRVITDGHSGLLVPFGDTYMLAEYVAKLLSDPALRAQLGAEGREQALTRYTWERCAATVHGVYDQVLSARRGSRRFRAQCNPQTQARPEHGKMETRVTDSAAASPTAGSTTRELSETRPPLRIGIDISRTIGQRTGVGSYAERLVEGLIAVDSENEYLLYPYFWECFHPDWRTARIPASPRFRLWSEDLTLDEIHRRWTTAPADEVAGKVDVLHSTAFTVPPPLSKTKLVVTVPDLTFLTHPHLHTEANRSFCMRQAEQWLERAAYLITLSEAARSDILKHLSFPAERVVAIHLAAAPVFSPATDLAAVSRVLAKHNILDNYLLFVGTLEPRKNAISLLRACADILRTTQPAHLLVLAGARGWMNSEVFAEVHALGLDDRVRFVGYVPDAELRVLYTAARVFVYPSIHEGFGLPVIEAMACGAPVITSTTSSLPEVAGDAGILVPPLDVPALRDALEDVLNNQAKRLRMRAQSLQRAGHFSWQATAKATLAVYRRAVEGA